MTSPANIYESIMVPAIFDQWAIELSQEVKEGDYVLDVGCGTGVVARYVVEHVGPYGFVVGLDTDPEMLAVAKKTVTGKFECREADATEMPFENDSFDVVLCQQGLQFIPEKQTAVNEMYRVLKPAGTLLISVWKSTDHIPGFYALESALCQLLDDSELKLPPFAFDDAEALTRLATEAGFKDAKVEQRTKITRFESVEELKGDGMTELVKLVESQLLDYITEKGIEFPQSCNILYASK
jgi:SAM-dependent methyltransferase